MKTVPALDTLDLDVVGCLDDDAITAIAELLIYLDSIPATAAPEATGDTIPGNQTE